MTTFNYKGVTVKGITSTMADGRERVTTWVLMVTIEGREVEYYPRSKEVAKRMIDSESGLVFDTIADWDRVHELGGEWARLQSGGK